MYRWRRLRPPLIVCFFVTVVLWTACASFFIGRHATNPRKPKLADDLSGASRLYSTLRHVSSMVTMDEHSSRRKAMEASTRIVVPPNSDADRAPLRTAREIGLPVRANAQPLSGQGLRETGVGTLAPFSPCCSPLGLSPALLSPLSSSVGWRHHSSRCSEPHTHTAQSPSGSDRRVDVPERGLASGFWQQWRDCQALCRRVLHPPNCKWCRDGASFDDGHIHKGGGAYAGESAPLPTSGHGSRGVPILLAQHE